jgi:hypothetical protein
MLLPMRADESERRESRAEGVIPCLLRMYAGKLVPEKT